MGVQHRQLIWSEAETLRILFEPAFAFLDARIQFVEFLFLVVLVILVTHGVETALRV